jgi:hypothetical protein
MSIRASSTNWWLSSLRHGLVLVLLLFALVDLSTTLPCCADEMGLPVGAVDTQTTVVASVGTDHEHAGMNIPASDEKAPAQPASGVDGCFCCAVGIAAVSLPIDAPRSRDASRDLDGISLPTASPRNPYRPPRIA